MTSLHSSRSAHGHEGIPVQVEVVVVTLGTPVALGVAGVCEAGWLVGVSVKIKERKFTLAPTYAYALFLTLVYQTKRRTAFP